MQDHRYGLYPANELAGISPDSVLKHCQLVKGKKEDDKTYQVLW